MPSSSASPGGDARSGSAVPRARPTPDYLTPFSPINEGSGPCRDPQFTLEQVMPTDHLYHNGETLSVNVHYTALGCTSLSGTFGVRHRTDSPRYKFYCRNATPMSDLDPCKYGFNGNIPSNKVDLTSDSGTVTLVAQPGTFPPAEVASVPDLEGAQLCAVVVSVSDGNPNGSHSFQQINVACPEGFYPHLGTPVPFIGTPSSIPPDLETPAVLMFCVPLQQSANLGHGQPIATVPSGYTILYKPQSCEPDIDTSGALAVRDQSGGATRIVPTYRPYRGAPLLESIVWTPATGDLNGMSTVMTATFLNHDATLVTDSLGQPIVLLNTSDDGAQIFGSLTERIGDPQNGLPLAIFLDGMPLTDRAGFVIAPVVQSKITNHLDITALQQVDAEKLVDLLNSGGLR